LISAIKFAVASKGFPTMTIKSAFLKAGTLALALAFAAPVAAHAASPLANDHNFIAELNAAYGTHFTADQSQK
jgi:hypothetical protein